MYITNILNAVLKKSILILEYSAATLSFSYIQYPSHAFGFFRDFVSIFNFVTIFTCCRGANGISGYFTFFFVFCQRFVFYSYSSEIKTAKIKIKYLYPLLYKVTNLLKRLRSGVLSHRGVLYLPSRRLQVRSCFRHTTAT